MEGLELVAFKIISSVGMAKSSYIEAMKLAQDKDIDGAYDKVKEGESYFTEGHLAHAQLIQKEACGEKITPTLLLIHAEDQLISAETIKIMTIEIIKLNNRLQDLEGKL